MLAAPRFLVVADSDHAMEAALAQVAPGAEVTAVPNWFDAVAEAVTGPYVAVLASAEPIERRPDAAVKTLRSVTGGGRLILFGDPTLEPLARKMTECGADDYVISPPSSEELAGILARAAEQAASQPARPAKPDVLPVGPLARIPLADLVLEALDTHPQNAAGQFIRLLNQRLEPAIRLHFAEPGEDGPGAVDEMSMSSCSLFAPGEGEAGVLSLSMPGGEDEGLKAEILAVLATQVEKLVALSERHNRLQKLAITDELTGLCNGRYFRHFLSKILETARQRQFHVTLLMFDIDNFKKYNDQFGHGAGDEILKQTGTLMRRCCREHDLVARISGDEFAVIFWEKDPPRQAYSAAGAPVSSRPPQTPQMIFERFRKLLAGHNFQCLGPTAPGTLTISAGMATFPWAAQSPEGLIEAADQALMFGAKKGGKNSIYLVGPEGVRR